MTTMYVRARSGVHVLITPSATVRDPRLSYRASGVLNRLLDNTEGFGMTAEDLAAERPGKEGRDAIRTALRELRAAGYIQQRAKMGAGGRFSGKVTLVYDTPQRLDDDGRPENPPAGFPPAGKPSYKSSKGTNEVKTSKAAASRARDPASAAAGESQQQQQRATRKARRVRSSGIVCWEEDDPQLAEAIEADATLGEVRAGVVAVEATGKDPVPDLVSRESQRVRRMREKAEQTKAREAAGPLAEERRRHEERARREADPVARRAGLDAMRKAAAELGFEGPDVGLVG